jgi:SHS2 domain-containing protein
MGFSYAEDGPTADLTVETWGETLEEVFSQAAIALFNAITPSTFSTSSSTSTR